MHRSDRLSQGKIEEILNQKNYNNLSNVPRANLNIIKASNIYIRKDP